MRTKIIELAKLFAEAKVAGKDKQATQCANELAKRDMFLAKAHTTSDAIAFENQMLSTFKQTFDAEQAKDYQVEMELFDADQKPVFDQPVTGKVIPRHHKVLEVELAEQVEAPHE